MCQLYNDMKSRENTWQGGFARPNSFVAWVHEIQIKIQNDLIKALGNSQVITDNLRTFIKSVQVPVSKIGKAGIIKYPDDYRYFSSVRCFSKKENGEGVLCADIEIMGDNNECRELTEEEKVDAASSDDLLERTIDMIPNQFWGSIWDDKVNPPSIENALATQTDKGFGVVPKGIGYVVLDYIAIPKRPTFIYIRDAQQNIICDPTKCENLNWGEEMIPEFLAGLKERYSAFTRNSEQYAQGRVESSEVKS